MRSIRPRDARGKTIESPVRLRLVENTVLLDLNMGAPRNRKRLTCSVSGTRSSAVGKAREESNPLPKTNTVKNAKESLPV